jgi:arylsulfatase
MKRTFASSILFLLILIFIVVSCSGPRQEQNPPNIIIILADDMGYSDPGFMGSEIQTPNLDKLAANGLLMTNFYNSGRCVPSRASLMTGLYSHQVGLGDMTSNDSLPAYQGYLNNQGATIAQMLKTAGYMNYAVGKWHLGEEQPECWPLQRGYDRFFGHQEGWGIYFYPFLRDFIKIYEGNETVPFDTSNFYYTDALNQKAVEYLQQHPADKPFFLYLAHSAPHAPLQAWEEDIARYRGKYRRNFEEFRQNRLKKAQELSVLPEDIDLSPSDELVAEWNGLNEAEKDLYDLRMAVYAAQLDRMDQGIGQLLAQLESMGVTDNTCIFFLSDNGGSTFTESSPPADYNSPPGERASSETYTPSWANVSNTPFRMYKKWAHEGGIATPLVVHFPKLIPAQAIDRQVGHIIDLMPTCLELAGVEYPDQYSGHNLFPLEGKSLLPVLEQKIREPHELLFWEHEGNQAVRKANWKAVKAFGNEQWELYNLDKDRVEINDLATTNPEILAELVQQFNLWAAKVGVEDWKSIQEARQNSRKIPAFL